MSRVRALLLVVALAPTAAAQTPARAELALGVALPSQPFGDPWTVGAGGAARLALPLHGGTAEGVLRALAYEGGALDGTSEAPGFTFLAATVGWGPTVRLGPAELTPLARVGAVQFRFDEDPRFGAQLQNEAEAAVGVALRLAVPVGRAAVWAEGEALHVALREPETVASLSAGLAVRVGLPPAVRRLLDE